MTHLFTALAIMLIAYYICKLFLKEEKKAEEQIVFVDADLKPLLKPLDLENEEKVRKSWLRAFFISTSLSTLILVLEKIESPLTPWVFFFHLFFSLLGVSIFIWITYYCAYKKRGTAWLMFQLIMSPIANLIGSCKALIYDSTEFGYIVTALGLIPGMIVAAYYWINCLRLRRVNLARKEYEKLAQKIKEAPMQDVTSIISA